MESLMVSNHLIKKTGTLNREMNLLTATACLHCFHPDKQTGDVHGQIA